MKHSIPLLIKLSLVIVLLQSCTAVNPKYNKNTIDRHRLSINNAVKMHKQFDSFRLELFNDKLKTVYNNPRFEDTKFVWMPLEDLKDYVNYIEDVKKTNPEDEVSGIRIYFSAYPNKRQFEDDQEIKHPGQQTVFMVPTVKSINTNERYNVMNHLPFAIKPYSNNNPIRGSFEILEQLMLSYHKGPERVKYYYENSKQEKPKEIIIGSQGTTGSTSGFSDRSTSSGNSGRNNEELTSLISNEFQQAPPPKKGDNN